MPVMAERPLWVGAPVFRLPWNKARPRCAAAGLLLILVAWPAAGGRAALFLGGRFMRKFPDLVRRMVAEGHEIASHLDTRDWVADTSFQISRSRDEIATRILESGGGGPGALNGGILLMHLNTLRQTDRPFQALAHLLKCLQA